jgi:hypothetical protein
MTEVPDFRRMWQAARAETARRRRRRRRVLAAAGAAAGLAGLLVLTGPPTPTAYDRDSGLRAAAELSRQIESWEGPLDVLLDTPGQAWLVTAPEFGEVDLQDWFEEGTNS